MLSRFFLVGGEGGGRGWVGGCVGGGGTVFSVGYKHVLCMLDPGQGGKAAGLY